MTKVSNVNRAVHALLFFMADELEGLDDLEVLAGLELAAEDLAGRVAFNRQDLVNLKMRVKLDRSLAEERHRRAQEYSGMDIDVHPNQTAFDFDLRDRVEPVPVEETEAYQTFQEISERVNTFSQTMVDFRNKVTTKK